MTSQGKTAAGLVAVVGVMVSLSFAAVPFYDWFCKVTGFGGTTATAAAAPMEMLERTVKVRFDASLEAGMPWQFTPQQREMTLRIGETGLAFYEAYNPSDRAVAGTASYNVFPYSVGAYFYKIACFCFTEQVLQPGERIVMPVSFYIDPAMVNDEDARHVQEITLSYTFHEAPVPQDQAALAPGTPGAIN